MCRESVTIQDACVAIMCIEASTTFGNSALGFVMLGVFENFPEDPDGDFEGLMEQILRKLHADKY